MAHVVVKNKMDERTTGTRRFHSVAQLRELLLGLEHDLGIGELSRNELDVLYALKLLGESEEAVVRSDAIRRHNLCSAIATPTFHRALRALVEKGFVDHAPLTKARAYKLGRMAGRLAH